MKVEALYTKREGSNAEVVPSNACGVPVATSSEGVDDEPADWHGLCAAGGRAVGG